MKQVKCSILVKVIITVHLITLKRKTTNQYGKDVLLKLNKRLYFSMGINTEIGKLDSKILHTVQSFFAF